MDHTDLTLAERLPHLKGFRCVVCGANYGLDEVQYVCPTCGPVGTLDMVYDYDRISATRPDGGARSMWYRALMPLLPDAAIRDEIERTHRRYTSAARRSMTRRAWPSRLGCGSCGSKMMAATPPHRSKTGPARWS